MDAMKALVKRGSRVALCAVPRPSRRSADEVLIRVVVAGICRTDLYVAQGRLPAADPVVLGHEFAGVVEEATAGGLRRGEWVAVLPLMTCGDCEGCATGRGLACLRRTMLGVDRDGAFAEYVVVPARCVRRVPAGMPPRVAAYAEPVAAALGVLNAGIRPDQEGLIYGSNRFARLIERVLRARGFDRLEVFDPSAPGSRPAAHRYDFVVETFATAEALAELVRAARPFGTVVLRSRQPWPAAIDLRGAIPKELTFRAVDYGPFDEAVALLAEGRLDLEGLLGPVYPLDDFAAAFALARGGESSKVFLAPAAEHVWDR